MKSTYKILIAILICLVSFFGVSRFATSTSTYVNAKTIETLDSQKKTVLALTAAATSASAAITLIPGDVATPIATKLADLSEYFLISLSAIFLEKYLLIICGYASFNILIPLACILYIVYIFKPNAFFSKCAMKLAAFGIILAMIIPASVSVSNMIQNTFENSIQDTITTTEETVNELQENEDDDNALLNLWHQISNTVSNATNNINTILNNFIEAVAIMIVTCCIIPILVLIFFVWLMKSFLGLDISMFK